MEPVELSELKANLFYCFRRKYYNLMLNACKQGMAKFRSDVSFHLYHALGLLLCNRVEECINELDVIKGEDDVKLAVTIALMYAHKLLGLTNKDLFVKLDGQMREYRKTTGAVDFYHSGFVLFVVNKVAKAIDYLDKSINLQSTSESLSLKGWLLVKLRQHGQKSANATETFESSLMGDSRNLDAAIGLVESCLYQNKHDDALNAANKTIVRFSSAHLALIAKMNVEFAAQDWEQVVETMNRIVDINLNDLDALKMNIIILLCRDANYEEGVLCIRKLLKQFDEKEPKNGDILLENAKLFSKLCHRNADILDETYKMVEKSVQINSENPDFIVELGYQCLLSNRTKEAFRYFKTATKIDDTNLNALMGLTLCELIENGKSDQIAKQIDFLSELEDAQNSPRLYLIKAKISDGADEALEFLKKIYDIQMNTIKSHPYSALYLELLDPDFMLEVVKEYLQYISSSIDLHSDAPSKTPSSTIKLAQHILVIITKACPGLYTALFLLAKLQFLNGEVTNAMNSLDQIMNKVDDDMSSEAHILMAQIQVKSGLYDRASQSLEVGLSHNFKVRENPIYHYIRGLVDKNMNNLQDAIKSLTTALSLVQTTGYELSNNEGANLTLSEKASIYIELIDVHNRMGQLEEASKLLDDAMEEFKKTPEEARIIILNADHEMQQKNIQSAMDLLGKITNGEPYYLQAKTKLANILLKYRKDKFAYLQCYEGMVAENPGPDSYLLLGDAYMEILEPDDALDAYNKAYQQNPKDPYLTSKMGKALVDTHYFAKAVAFYKDAIALTDDDNLKLELADLYMQLKRYEEAEALIRSEIDFDGNKDLDLTYLQYKTKLYNLLAQTLEKSGNVTGAFSALKEAKDNQTRVRKRIAVEQTNIPEDETKLLTDIGVKLAEISINLKNNDQGIQFYKDLLDVTPNDTNIMASLAKLYLQINCLDYCQQICANILKIDSNNESASVMMADIAFRKIDFDMALFHFTQLIVKQPTNWTALVRLVEIMRRTGSLEEVPEYLNNAETSCPNPHKECGLLYCTALYQWYAGNLNGALRNFNGARQDPEWGLSALYNMIEICLNPDDEMMNGQFIDSDDTEYRDSRSMALKTADRLLKELKTRLQANGEDLFKYRLLVNFRLLATQEKPNIEHALEDFISIASQTLYKDHIGPILGMATAYTLLKQSQRAKNQLKRVAKTVWTFEDAEYLERCWLLLSDYYIQSTKFDVANDLINKVVQHNKACSKAYEYLGFIAEKEQRYKDAVNYYSSAWKFCGKSNAGVGFKLAFSSMKCKKYADAIDIGQQVLKLNPEYPRVKKDILDKSISNLRM